MRERERLRRVLVFISSRRFGHIRIDKKERGRDMRARQQIGSSRRKERKKKLKNRNEMEEEKGSIVINKVKGVHKKGRV